MMAWSALGSQAVIKGKGQAPVLQRGKACMHCTQSFHRQLIPQRPIPQGVRGCAHSFMAPLSQ